MPPRTNIYRCWLWLGLAVLPILEFAPVRAQGINPLPPIDQTIDQTLALPDSTRKLAQTPSLPRPEEPPPPSPLPELPPKLPPPADLLTPTPTETPTPPSQEIPPEAAPATITVERFNVTGSTVFSPAELAEATQPFVGRSITLAELFEARTAVTDLYIQRGYITSGAYIPPQTLQDGVIEIRVIEGTVDEIRVTGNRRLRPAYIQSRLGLAARKPLNRDRLLEALQLLQLNPLISSISAELSAGTRPGESRLDVQVTEASSISVQALLDNGRSPSVGTDRRQIQFNQANLLGFGDGLSIAYTNTDGSNAADFGYVIPVSPSNATVSLNFSITNSKIIEAPFDILNIRSKSRTYELTFRQPILQTPNQEIALGITATRRESRATFNPGNFGEEPFPSTGSDDDGRTRVSAVRFFQEWVKRSSREVFAVRSQFSLGLNLLDSTINDRQADSRFFAWRGQAQWVRLLAPETLLLLRGDVQLADQPLVPIEQFGLGGIESVRGYRQDVLLTDSGLLLSAEARVPILRIPEWEALLQIAPFVEFGAGWNQDEVINPDPNELASIGLGLRLQVSNNLTARLDWGIPLITIDGSKDTWQEDGVYFSIIYNPF